MVGIHQNHRPARTVAAGRPGLTGPAQDATITLVTHPWTTPELTGVGRLPMHSVRHADRLELDGTWRFQLLSRPEDEPGRKWRDIEVPGCWTMQDTFDKPHYTNVQMPFAGQPPEIPAANPTGVYERTFTVPAEWAGRRVVLHVGAAESVLIAILNGVEIGVGKDAHLASEFDVTDRLKDGTNTLTLRVVKWSDATYVEDQDQWWHGGITRSVYLYATGAVHVADIAAIAGLADDLTTGTLDLTVDIGFAGVAPTPGWTVEAEIDGLLPVVRATNELPGTSSWPFPDVVVRHIVGGPPAVADDRDAWDEEFRRQAPPLPGRVAWHLEIPDVPAGRPRSRPSMTCASPCGPRTARSWKPMSCASASGGSRSVGWTSCSTGSGSSSGA